MIFIKHSISNIKQLMDLEFVVNFICDFLDIYDILQLSQTNKFINYVTKNTKQFIIINEIKQITPKKYSRDLLIPRSINGDDYFLYFLHNIKNNNMTIDPIILLTLLNEHRFFKNVDKILEYINKHENIFEIMPQIKSDHLLKYIEKINKLNYNKKNKIKLDIPKLVNTIYLDFCKYKTPYILSNSRLFNPILWNYIFPNLVRSFELVVK